MQNLNLKQKIIFLVIFLAIGLVFLQIPFTAIVGSKQNFSLFDFYGPITGIFLGGPLGFLGVFLAKFINIFIANKPLDVLTIVRLFPLAFAALYLSTQKKWIGIVGPICIVLFIAHPVGRGAWYYSLYWLIPLAIVFFKKRLILNSLGATFTAHAIGSTVFLYTIPTTSSMWQGLIPQVAIERGLFALGIFLSVIIFNWLLTKISIWLPILKNLTNADYLVNKHSLKHHL